MAPSKFAPLMAPSANWAPSRFECERLTSMRSRLWKSKSTNRAPRKLIPLIMVDSNLVSRRSASEKSAPSSRTLRNEVFTSWAPFSAMPRACSC